MLLILAATSAVAQTANQTTNADTRPGIAQVEDAALSQIEKELVPLAEAMPADKYQFAPTAGAFQNVRTFALQMRHIATVNYQIAAALLGEKMPIAVGSHENGADSLNNKDAIVQYLKDSFAYAHRAVKTLTEQNQLETLQQPWKDTRLSLANTFVWHSYDHYGQAVVYLRMAGVIPPASR